jgi:GTP cyclohydrolase II
MKRQAEAMLPTDWGNFNMIAFADDESDKFTQSV